MKKENAPQCALDSAAQELRTELCLHTTVSGAVSLITPKALMQRGQLFGLKAVAVTDWDSVQNFRELARCRERYAPGLKVIYGAALTQNGGELITVLVKDQAGLKPLYKLISGKRLTEVERSHLLVGACDPAFLAELARDEAAFSSLAEGYDYIALLSGREDAAVSLNQRLYDLCFRFGKTVVAVGDCRYLSYRDRAARNAIVCHRGGEGRHLQTTQEMLAQYAYLGEEAARQVVLTNPDAIAAAVEQVDPRKGDFPRFSLPDAQGEVKKRCRQKLRSLYGGQSLVRQRLEAEFAQVTEQGYSMYLLCHKLVSHLQEKGGLTGTRGTVGSTLIAYLLGISDINPLPAHHRCPSCKHTEFADKPSGFDLRKTVCPICGATMVGDGHNIPFETCLGVDRDMEPDVDINTTAAMQEEAKRFLAQWLGAERVAVAGVFGTYSRHRAKALLQGQEQAWLADLLAEVKRCEGKHPGGIMLLPEGMEWEDVTPLRPLDDPSCPVATHMDCHSIDPAVPKLDVLAVNYYSQLQALYAKTGVKPEEVDYQDPAVYALFRRANTNGIPEFCGAFEKALLGRVEATAFSHLVKVSGMAHGTEVWRNNGEFLLGEHDLQELISCRDDIFQTLQSHGVDRGNAYMLMTAARKGRLPWEGKAAVTWPGLEKCMEVLENSGVPQWYAQSMRKVYYLFPKAHAAHYTKLAVAFAWFKRYYPEAFYGVMLEGVDGAALAWCSDDQLRNWDQADRREWEKAQLLLEARQRGYASGGEGE